MKNIFIDLPFCSISDDLSWCTQFISQERTTNCTMNVQRVINWASYKFQARRNQKNDKLGAFLPGIGSVKFFQFNSKLFWKYCSLWTNNRFLGSLFTKRLIALLLYACRKQEIHDGSVNKEIKLDCFLVFFKCMSNLIEVKTRRKLRSNIGG